MSENVSDWIIIANTAGAIVVVVLFLKFLKDDRESRQGLEHQCHQHTSRLTDVMAEALRDSALVVKDNTKALGEVTVLIHDLRAEIRRDSRSIYQPHDDTG